MSVVMQTISDADSLAVLRRRMIHEVEAFLEWSIARGGMDAGRIPTRSASPSRSADPAGSRTSWYHDRSRRSSSVGEAGPC